MKLRCKIMKLEHLFIFLMIFTMSPVLVIADSDKVYIVNLEYSYGKISVDNRYVKPGSISTEIEQTGDYRYELISFKDDILYTSRFNIETSFVAPPPLGHEEAPDQKIELEELSFSLVIPYFENGKTIEIYDSGDNKILSTDVGYFAKVCGDSICEPHESYEDCPQDCPSGAKDDYCDKMEDGVCDPDCSKEQDIDCRYTKPGKTGEPEKTSSIYYIILAVILAALAAFVLYRRLQEKKKWEELERKHTKKQ